MSDSLRPPWTVAHWALWYFPGKNTRVGCHFLLQEIFPTQGSNLHLLHWQVNSLSLSHLGSPTNIIYHSIYLYLLNFFPLIFPSFISCMSFVKLILVCAKLLQSCPILCNSTDCSPPGTSVHEILQARILEWFAVPSPRGLSRFRD